jgi:hypothetical protein
MIQMGLSGTDRTHGRNTSAMMGHCLAEPPNIQERLLAAVFQAVHTSNNAKYEVIEVTKDRTEWMKVRAVKQGKYEVKPTNKAV